MTANTALPLKFGLCARGYVTHVEIAAQKRAQARKKAKHNDAQLQLDEETNDATT
jgi:hypothetical protein